MRAQQSYHRLLFQVFDMVWVTLSWWFAFWLRFYSGYFSKAEVPSLSTYLVLNVAMILTWIIGLQLTGAYRFSRTRRIGQEIVSSVKGSLLSFLIIIAMTYFIAREDFSRLVFGLYLATVIFTIVVGRTLLHSVVRKLRRRGWNQAQVLLVGDKEHMHSMRQKISARLDLGLHVCGAVALDDAAKKNITALGAEIEKIVREKNVDQVIITLRNEDAGQLDSVLETLLALAVEVKIVPDVMQYSLIGFEVEEFDGVPFITLNQSPIQGWNAILKRISDVFYSLFAILVFSPIMITLAVLVKLSSRGPVFYKQERMGLDGKTFWMLKFRSMPVDAESKSGAVWAKKEDQRATWIGAIMRKTSLDELPQFFNVLWGDMSCVGPRPERPVFVEKFRKEIPGYMLRHKVKAGITGWAQINGFRGNTSLEGRIKYDLYYITHWNLIFDLRIMFLTLFKGFISPNAY